jgi:hypothetical protein
MESHWVRRANARRSSRFMAQSLRSGVSPPAECVQIERPSEASRTGSARRYPVAKGGPAPTASGANSVASALGSVTRRDPGEAVRSYHEGCTSTFKTGTFYLAGRRNFLFGSDNHTNWRVDLDLLGPSP